MFTHIHVCTLFINVIRVLFVLKLPVALFFIGATWLSNIGSLQRRAHGKANKYNIEHNN